MDLQLKIFPGWGKSSKQRNSIPHLHIYLFTDIIWSRYFSPPKEEYLKNSKPE
jgi:hypothetical protein